MKITVLFIVCLYYFPLAICMVLKIPFELKNGMYAKHNVKTVAVPNETSHWNISYASPIIKQLPSSNYYINRE